jgi:hypothetical protein
MLQQAHENVPNKHIGYHFGGVVDLELCPGLKKSTTNHTRNVKSQAPHVLANTNRYKTNH